MQRKTFIKVMIILVVIIIFVWYPSLLDVQFPGSSSLPLGSLITATGMIIWSLFFRDMGSWHRSSQKDLQYLLIKNLSSLTVLLSLSWFFISWYLSGNLQFSFTNAQDSFEKWWDITYLTILCPPLLFIADKIWSLIRQLRSHY